MDVRTKLPDFTLRESDILHLLARRYSRKEIADALHIRHATVNAHLHSIFKKTDLHNIIDLIFYAQDRGFGKQSPRITEALTPLPVNTQNSETM
jgi:DNA-binding NarL/FixJ family response regulator